MNIVKSPATVADIIAAVSAAPADAESHRQLAECYVRTGKLVPAIAEYRTALALGATDDRIRTRIAACLEAVTTRRPPETISHNLYSRTQWLARHIRSLFPSGKFSILDAGGGDGRLAIDLPDADYVLAEPTTNGIFISAELSFHRKFDVVVCCHVLEHIPLQMRDQFLDGLCGMTNEYLLLLNPVADSRVDQQEGLRLVVEVTGANWAKEHLECVLPRLEDITGFADRRGYTHRVKPNGSKALAMAIVFLDHYAKAGQPAHVARINRLFNSIALDDLDNPSWPNAYLVEIQTRKLSAA